MSIHRRRPSGLFLFLVLAIAAALLGAFAAQCSDGIHFWIALQTPSKIVRF